MQCTKAWIWAIYKKEKLYQTWVHSFLHQSLDISKNLKLEFQKKLFQKKKKIEIFSSHNLLKWLQNQRFLLRKIILKKKVWLIFAIIFSTNLKFWIFSHLEKHISFRNTLYKFWHFWIAIYIQKSPYDLIGLSGLGILFLRSFLNDWGQSW